ncbi:MAG TPA: hypothetical protein DCS07_02085 [Bdellovibrionales bacterium]|nr:hypothetical protein [Bdellovibrionales bacterium]HCM39951.1 hypothetical protein [Bdellovibrionales bacterium]
MSSISLETVFDEVNQKYFDGFLDRPVLRWNSRLRASAGRFFPGSRKFFYAAPPVIEIAAYLLQENESQQHVSDTVAHEMIHYWLWVRKRPYGHTPEFHSKMNALGVSRYNKVPRLRRFHYIYRCDGCGKEFPVRRKLGTLACSNCCKLHARGKYDSRFILVLTRTLSALEAAQLSTQKTGA